MKRWSAKVFVFIKWIENCVFHSFGMLGNTIARGCEVFFVLYNPNWVFDAIAVGVPLFPHGIKIHFANIICKLMLRTFYELALGRAFPLMFSMLYNLRKLVDFRNVSLIFMWLWIACVVAYSWLTEVKKLFCTTKYFLRCKKLTVSPWSF